MPSQLPKNIIKLVVALLKHQATRWLGEEAVGIAGKTLIEIGGEQLQQRIDTFLSTREGSQELLNAVRRADDYFQRNCEDDELRQALSLSVGNLPAVQEALADLPDAMDAGAVERALQEALARDIPSLTAAQTELGARLYTEGLQRALLQVKEFTLPIIGQTVLDIKSKLAKLDMGQEEIQASQERIEQRLSGLPLISRQWSPPPLPRLNKPMVGRAEEFKIVKEMLKPGKQAAVTVTVQGTAGVGKTVLVQHLTQELAPLFPGGVIFQLIGSKFRDPILCNPILKQWAGYAFGGRAPDEFQPNPDEVRGLLAGHGSMLIVLDDIWDVKAVEPLLAALPNEACLLVSTRSRRIAQELHGDIFPLDVLTPADSLALFRARVPSAAEGDIALLKELGQGLGFHAQALDIAGGSLARLPKTRWPMAVQEMIRQVHKGSGFGELHLPGDEEAENHVEAALSVSYGDLKTEAQFRFRALGVFAPDAGFRVDAAALVWKCDVEDAEVQLIVLVELGLLNRFEQPGLGVFWQQHTLLRAYALALLRRAGEEEAGRTLHASIYYEFMQGANDRQTYYLMLPDYPQIRNAFEWALEHNLELALALAANAANLQAAFYLVRENYDWAQRLLLAAQEGENQQVQAKAEFSRAIALGRLADLPDEDRHARLLEALAAFDEALKFHRPDTAPLDYATTQNNRGAVLRDLAASPDEDRRARLLEALAAYDEALKFRRPDTAPLDYAATQNNRGIVLVDLAASPDEDRHARLLEALAAFDEALKFRRPDTAPLDYAMTQNNRGAVLRDLAASPDEDRHARLLEALAAFDEALKFRRPDTAPLAYAATQNNRGIVLVDLAASPDEDRRARLLEALAAYDEALKFRRPDTAPLAYAATQNNRGIVLVDLAASPDEDRRARLLEALAAFDEALKFRRSDTAPLDYAATQNNRGIVLRDLAASPDKDRHARLLEALAAFDEALKFRRPDTAPLDYAATQANLAILYVELSTFPEEDRLEKLRMAISSTVTALTIFIDIKHEPYTQHTARQLKWVSEQTGPLFPELWESLELGEMPEWLR